MGTIRGDTSFLSSTDKREFERFFYKNVRIPMVNDSDITGTCNLYFIVDKTGTITQAWYDQKMNNEIGATALYPLKKIPPRLKPTMIGKEPVITKMMISLAIITNDENEANERYIEKAKADLIFISYGVQHKREIISLNGASQ